MAKTYREWEEEGYYVRKGEKATGRNRLGEATFTRNQVDESDDYDDSGGWDEYQWQDDRDQFDAAEGYDRDWF